MLPREIWFYVFDYIDTITLYRKLSICKAWQGMITHIINSRLGIGKQVRINLDELNAHYPVAAMCYATRYNRYDIISQSLSKYSKAFYRNVRFTNIDILSVLLKQQKIELGKVFQHLPCGHPGVPKLIKLVTEQNLSNVMIYTPPSRHPSLYNYIQTKFTDDQSRAMMCIWEMNLSSVKRTCISHPQLMKFMEEFAIELKNANLAMTISTYRRQYDLRTCDASAEISRSL
jgi:hypothetical protein